MTRRLRGAANIIVDVFLENESVFTRQEVCDASRRTIGDTELFDFVLKSSSNCIVGSYVVRRRQNIDMSKPMTMNSNLGQCSSSSSISRTCSPTKLPSIIAETRDSWFNCQKLKLPKGCNRGGDELEGVRSDGTVTVASAGFFWLIKTFVN